MQVSEPSLGKNAKKTVQKPLKSAGPTKKPGRGEKKHALEVARVLEALYPDPQCTLDYGKPYELLFNTRLAAQCTDARVNQITPALYEAFPTLEAFANASVEEVETFVYSCGFYHQKAKDLIASAGILLDEHGGQVPDTMEALLRLPGIGRKTANLVLGELFGQPAAVVDTHCIRLTNRLGLCHGTDPVKTEKRLWDLLPPEELLPLCHRFVHHGRAVCMARKPRCGDCTLEPLCQWTTDS